MKFIDKTGFYRIMEGSSSCREENSFVCRVYFNYFCVSPTEFQGDRFSLHCSQKLYSPLFYNSKVFVLPSSVVVLCKSLKKVDANLGFDDPRRLLSVLLHTTFVAFCQQSKTAFVALTMNTMTELLNKQF